MDINIGVHLCPQGVVAPVERERALGTEEFTEPMYCNETNRSISITTQPPAGERRSPLVLCNLREDGTCPFLKGKEK